MPESNSQQKSTQMIASATSKWGLNREEQATVLRVRTRPECPEGNRRELMWDSNLNCGIARERERINRWKAPTEHTVTPSQNKGRTEQFQRRTGQGWTGPSPTGNRRQGGGERGKHGPRDGIPYQTANRLPVSNQRLPETLDGWHLLGGSQPEISFPEGTQGAPDRCTGKLRLGPWRGWGALHPGGVCPSSSWLPELLGRGRQKTQAQPSLRLCGGPKNLNLRGLALGSAHNSGPAPYRAAWSLSSVDGEAPTPWAGANPVWPEHCGSSLHRPVTFVCSVPPPHSTTGQVNLNKRPPLPACARAEIGHWRDLQTEAK